VWQHEWWQGDSMRCGEAATSSQQVGGSTKLPWLGSVMEAAAKKSNNQPEVWQQHEWWRGGEWCCHSRQGVVQDCHGSQGQWNGSGGKNKEKR